ncbi:glycosyltransferase [Salmonirosea aquatica]
MDPAMGGPCQGIRNSIPELEKLGVQNEVVCLDQANAGFLESDTFPIHFVGRAVGPWWYHKALVPWLLTNFSRFDIVIVHGLWLYPSYAVWKIIKSFKANHESKSIPKVYVMPHGMLDPWFQRAHGRKFKAVRNKIYWKLLEANVVNDADGLLFTCEEELKLAREAFSPYKPKKELNVGYGILPPPSYIADMDRAFKYACPGIDNKSYLLFLSRIDVKKGVDLLIQAYLALKKEGYKLPALVIAGPGEKSSYGLKVIKIASKDDGILFPGMLKGDAKWGAFYGCEAFVLPSHQENFGIAVVEALACGKPALISNRVNIWREIKDGKSGLIDTDTLYGVKQLILKWINLSQDKRVEMEQSAKKLFQKKFNISLSAKKLLEVLKA